MDYSQLGNKRRLRQKNPHATRIRNKIGLFALRGLMAIVLIVGFTGVAAVLGLYLGILYDAPDLFNEALVNENRTGRIVSAVTGEEIERLHYARNHEFAPFHMFPQYLIDAFVAIEDERFWEHNGVDMRRIVSATFNALTGYANHGASTITQQLIKNMLRRFDSDLITKLQEQYLAVSFERQLTEELGCRIAAKEFILESYMNIINLGRQNEGVQAAAMFYYGVCVSELTLAQSATIAAITQNPSRFPPDTRPLANWGRTRWVLYNMYHRSGFITTEQFEYAMRERQFIDPVTGLPLYDYDAEGEWGPVMIGLVYDTIYRTADGGIREITSDFDCFHDAMIDQVRDDLAARFGITTAQASDMIFRGGLTIFSTQDPRAQAAVDRVFLDESYWPQTANRGFSIDLSFDMTVVNTITGQRRSYGLRRTVSNMDEAREYIERRKTELLVDTDEIEFYREHFLPQPQGAFIVMDHHTGFVTAVRGIRGPKEGSRAFNRATQALRSPGSQMKPLVPFAPAFDLGLMQPATVIDDIPFTHIAPGAAPWDPGNWWSPRLPFEGLSTARRAIYRSQNVVSARAAADTTINSVGVPTMRAYLERMGISTLQPTDGAAMVLGGMAGVYLLELAGAYASIANMGNFNRPVLYTMVLDYYGNIILDNTPNPTRVLQETTAYLLIDTMRDTMRRAGATGHRINWTNTQMRTDIPVAGKTGTSQRNADLGFSGFTPYYTASIWLGNDSNVGMTWVSETYHLPIWRSIMEEIHYGLEPRSFERPAGITTVSVCLDSGMRATELCRTDPRGNRARNDIFAPGLVPLHDCNVHVQFTYCSTHGMLAGTGCHLIYDNVRTRVGLVRHQPIDHIPDTPIPIADRVYEVPLAVRQGNTCLYCVAAPPWGGHDPWDWWWNPPQAPPLDGYDSQDGYGIPGATFPGFPPSIPPDTPPDTLPDAPDSGGNSGFDFGFDFNFGEGDASDDDD
jgi:penicillin-binding protein 1A